MLNTFVVNVPTPGTPVNLFTAISAQLASLSGGLSGPMDLKIRGLMLQAAPGNTATKNMWWGTKGMVVSSLTKVGGALLPGVFSPPFDFTDTMISLAEIYIDADTATTVANMLVTVIA